jgi:hypothetical protein
MTTRSVIDEIIPAATEDDVDAVEIEKPTRPPPKQRPEREHPSRSARKRNIKAIPEGHYTEGGFGRVPYYLIDLQLVAAMRSPTLKAYLACGRLADNDGSFFVGYNRLGGMIGVKDRQTVKAAMHQLMDAGLIRRRWKGTPGRVSGYVLLSLATLDVVKALAVLRAPYREDRGADHAREQRDIGALKRLDQEGAVPS